MAHRSPQLLIDLLRSKPAVQLAQIQAALHGASRSTAFRYLEQIPYRSSYSHNGRYYALHDSSRYDRWGLFSVGDIHFSVEATLKATVIRLVSESEAGWTQRELQEILRVRVQLFVLDAFREGFIARQQIGRLYVYLHRDTQVGAVQLERRQARIEEQGRAQAELNDELIIRVLLVLLRYPGSQPADVVRRLKGRPPPITRVQVDAVYARYGLGEKGGPWIY